MEHPVFFYALETPDISGHDLVWKYFEAVRLFDRVHAGGDSIHDIADKSCERGSG
ncbi:hypothetical protein ACQP0C_35665 [Nocardia sp. CA-129566]|uniref:hypothetical protein n=1 Tax=Nocardia sp. CA-129566 TaxID=3239976 RepID=UPI003D97EA87